MVVQCRYYNRCEAFPNATNPAIIALSSVSITPRVLMIAGFESMLRPRSYTSRRPNPSRVSLPRVRPPCRSRCSSVRAELEGALTVCKWRVLASDQSPPNQAHRDRREQQSD